jgi:hypothetical protein
MKIFIALTLLQCSKIHFLFFKAYAFCCELISVLDLFSDTLCNQLKSLKCTACILLRHCKLEDYFNLLK